MAYKIKKVAARPYHTTIKKTDSTLCCSLNPVIQCRFCETLLCKDCGRAWSGRKHFLLDLCRGRFSEAQIKESNACFKERLVDGKVVGLGDCLICIARAAMADNGADLDRMILSELRKR